MGFTVDTLRAGDAPALQQVCIRTGDAGEDASELFTHPELLHLVYLDPYLALEADLVRVLRDAAGSAVGYVVAPLLHPRGTSTVLGPTSRLQLISQRKRYFPLWCKREPTHEQRR